MIKYTTELIQKLQKETEILPGFHTDVLLKKSPTEPRPGYLDPYERACLNINWVAGDQKDKPEELSPEELLQQIRDRMGFPNFNLNTEELITKYEELKLGENQVGLWRYYKRKSTRGKRPCLVYIHGGGFIGGTVYCMENPCKLIAQLADAVVFNIDYSLAPEKPFPNGLNDIYNAIRHIYENADSYGIDRNKIAVAGDSAGGNYSAVVALKARDEKLPLLAAQILIYPAVVLGAEAAEGYSFREEEFVLSEEEKSVIAPMLGLGRPGDISRDPMISCYLPEVSEVKNPYVSPMLAESHADLPKALIAVAEFDGLRLQGEFYAGMLQKAGVETRVLRYAGMTHAFLDRLGHVPQAEDLCIEIAKLLKEL